MGSVEFAILGGHIAAKRRGGRDTVIPSGIQAIPSELAT
jgi:hypothetical protein